MIKPEQVQQVQKRLAVYQQGSQFSYYLSSVSQLYEICQSVLMGNLTEESQFNEASLTKLRQNIGTKYVENKIMIECEKMKVNVQDISVESALENAKADLKEVLPSLREFRNELESRNERLEQMAKDIKDFNYENHQLAIAMTTLKLSKEAWVDLLGEAAFDKLLASKVFHVERNGLYTIRERLLEPEDELRRINSVMKDDIRRLNQDLQNYQSKWLQNAEVVERIGEVLRQGLVDRSDVVKPGDVDIDEEEEDERYMRQDEASVLSAEGDDSDSYEEDEDIDEDDNERWVGSDSPHEVEVEKQEEHVNSVEPEEEQPNDQVDGNSPAFTSEGDNHDVEMKDATPADDATQYTANNDNSTDAGAPSV
ncbi:HGL268Wp [Eremothecium sinecaudum]|uniref:HGL268Wp n=1 Tax=Eremothecium sinecaudum TaxID=45286 RepID=A0A0X8HV33_9SACH|nr:HGL268Wp [Eremothecium sinecaudum]AMD22072.1 HGL268Wp [Eremothecium sinecaudum]